MSLRLSNPLYSALLGCILGTAVRGQTSPPADARVVLLAGPAVGGISSPARYGDIDGDGVPDLVASTASTALNPEPRLVTAHGRGNGLFDSFTPLADGYSYVLPLIDGDLDGDLDVLTSSFDEAGVGTITAFLSDGHGHFAGSVTSELATLPVSAFAPDATAADMDGDGLPDIVLAGSSLLSIAHGVGDGSFTEAQHFNLPSLLPTVALADFDLDGHVDVATNSDLDDNSVLVYRGLPGGGLAPQPLISMGSQPQMFAGGSVRLVTGDFDADGLEDVALLARLPATTEDYVALFRGAGDATFTQVDDVMAPSSGPAGVGDVNGDGRADVVIGSGFASVVSLLLSTAAPSFEVEQLVGERVSVPPEVVDVNADGHADIALGEGLILGSGQGTWLGAESADLGKKTMDVHVADVDGDGNSDVLGGLNQQATLGVAFGDGSGGFRAASVFNFGAPATATAAADFDGDGLADVAIAQQVGLGVRLNLGAGLAWSALIPLDAKSTSPPQIVDVDGDGADDVVAIELETVLQVFSGDGHGAFSTGKSSALASPADSMALRDFDVDGLLDVALVGSSGAGLSVQHGLGAGLLGPAQLTPAEISQHTSLVAADWNEDGLADCATGTADLYNDNISVLFAVSTTSFGAPTTYPTSHANELLATDLDRDGHIDLIEGRNDLLVSVRRGLGDGTFAETFASAPGGVRRLAAGDLDGDGFAEIVMASDQSFVALANVAAPFASLGFENDAGFGLAHLAGQGTTIADQKVSLVVSGLTPGAPGLLFVGLQFAPHEFKGGTLVLAPDLVLPIRAGEPLIGRWPEMPVGTTIYAQAWFVVGGRVAGSNAVMGITHAGL